ncbi:LysR family transcriptional regulator [Microbacterium sp. NPDC006705]|uniref:LysR family transcriptional regulator n=1 Tax=Microbacterium TaxID=33882 RepID=UPI000DCB4401|nr:MULTISPECIES: LysR family transcriptional regulator [Microbacterium]RAZ31378.1 hypothetical protein DO944_10510 [Microbacterium sp. SMR1]
MADLFAFASFAAVVEEGSISAGARRRSITQPAMSRQIQRLEEELGVRLLVRGNGPVRPTPAGARFYDRVTDLLALAENVVGRTKQESGQTRAILHVIAPSATITSAIAPYLVARGAAAPVLDCDDADPFRVFDLAATRGADLGISTTTPRPGWRGRRLSAARVWAHVPREHDLARRAEVGVGELVQHPLVLLTPNSAARRALDHEVGRAGLAYDDPITVRQPAIARALVAAGRGIAVLTDDPAPGTVTVPIAGADGCLEAQLYAGWDADGPRAPLIEAVVDDLAGFLAERGRGRARQAARRSRLVRSAGSEPEGR